MVLSCFCTCFIIGYYSGDDSHDGGSRNIQFIIILHYIAWGASVLNGVEWGSVPK
jgi:hypothetical protein